MDKFKENCESFADLSKNSSSFLIGDENSSSRFIQICSDLHQFAKSCQKIKESDPFYKLHTEGFDDEQIWQQIEMFNNERVGPCMDGMVECRENPDLQLIESSGAKDVDYDSDEDLMESDLESGSEEVEKEDHVGEEDQGEEEYASENDEGIDSDDPGNPPEVLEKTEVDDDFFSLRRMEKCLDEQENNGAEASDDDIDYFNHIPSEDDEEEGFPSFPSDGEQSEEEEDLEDEASNASSREDKSSARHMKHDDFFPTLKSKTQPPPPQEEPKEEEEEEEVELSNYAKQESVMQRRLRQLEERAVGDPDWQMRGETSGDKRPVNSLLEEVLAFDHAERTAPEVTDEQTHDLESIIRQRIKDAAWDDVERKIKESRTPREFKKKVVLDQEKSKLSLQEIYEKEYAAKMAGEKAEDKEDPKHVEIESLMKSLFRKLDALSHFHFQAAVPTPEIKVVTNLPAIAMEGVQPVSHSEEQMLAPEEVHKGSEVKGEMEKTSTDRKKLRRKKKAKQKARAEQRKNKLEALADTNEKLKTVQAMNKLEKSAKMPGSHTTIIKNSKKPKESLTSSRTFFSKLEEGKTQTNRKRKIS